MKISKKQFKQLKLLFPAYKLIEEKYWRDICKLEKTMQEITGIKDIELFFCDGELAGIGNASRTMKLIHRNQLENDNN